MLPFLGLLLALQQPSPASAAVPAPAPLTEAELAGKLGFYRRIARLRVPFHQVKWMRDMDLRLRSEGQLSLERPDHVVWEVTKPAPLRVEMGKAGVHIESGSGSSRTTQDFKAEQLSAGGASGGAASLVSMAAWLSLDAHELSRQYRVVSVGPRTFRFEPREDSAITGFPFNSLEMQLAQDGHLEHLRIEEVSRDQIDIEFGSPAVTPER